MYYPEINSLENSREAIVQFGGLQDKALTDDGFFRETQFVDNDNFPYLTAKCSRYEHKNIFPVYDNSYAMVVTMIKKGGKLHFLLKYEVAEDDYEYILYYYNFHKNCWIDEQVSDYANDDTKLISYGAYILLFTDYKIQHYYNTQVDTTDKDYQGSAVVEVKLPLASNPTGEATFVLCNSDGEVYADVGSEDIIVSKTAPNYKADLQYHLKWTCSSNKPSNENIIFKLGSNTPTAVVQFKTPSALKSGDILDVYYYPNNNPFFKIECWYKNTKYYIWAQELDYSVDYANCAVMEEISYKTGIYWYDTDSHALKKYSDNYGMWTPVTNAYLKFYIDVNDSYADDWTQDLKEGDKIKLYGVANWDITCGTEIEKSYTIYKKGKDNNRPFIVIDNVLKYGYYFRQCFWYKDKYTKPTGYEGIKIVRDMPEMDFITVSNNKLWGCHKGINTYHKVESINYEDFDSTKRIMTGYGIWNKNKNVNEIYASSLGSFKNWYNYGTSADSGYAVSLGDDGDFTGAFTYQGYPMFFKENNVYKIYGSYPAQYQLQTLDFRGVEKGADKTLAIAGGYLVYKSPKDFVIFDGSSITSISKNIKFEKGSKEYATKVEFMPYNATGLGDSKYYCTAVHKGYDDNKPHWYVFIYDIEKGFWIKQKNAYFVSVVSDNSGALYYAPIGDGKSDLAVCREGDYDFALSTGNQSIPNITANATITEEHNFEWFVETGYQGFEYPDHKYIQRFNIRANVPLNKILKVKISYDGGEFEEVGRISGDGKPTTTTIRIIPKRCDYYALRLDGDGDAIIYGIYRTLKQGSDIK